MNTYSNVERIRTYLSLASQNVSDDSLLLGYLNRASRSIDKYTRRWFYPRRETHYFDYDRSQSVFLDDDLLTLDGLFTMNGASQIANAALFLMTGDNYNIPPYDRIVLKSNSGSLLYYSGTDQQANQVTGLWGYHEDYTNAWVDTGTSLAASCVSTDKSISLAGAGSYGVGASDANYEAPRIVIGDTLKIGDEFLYVVGGAASGNGSPIVLRSQNGTSANNFVSGTAIYRYSPDPDIQWATERLTAWLYGQSSTPYETKTAYIGLGGVSYPQGLATDVKQRLDRFKHATFVIYPDRH